MMVAAGAGPLSFLSPCVLPRVPSYLAFVAGVSFGDLRTRPSRTAHGAMVLNALGFIAGFLPGLHRDGGRGHGTWHLAVVVGTAPAGEHVRALLAALGIDAPPRPQAAPAFTLRDLGGTPRSLADVLLYFWTTW